MPFSPQKNCSPTLLALCYRFPYLVLKHVNRIFLDFRANPFLFIEDIMRRYIRGSMVLSKPPPG